MKFNRIAVLLVGASSLVLPLTAQAASETCSSPALPFDGTGSPPEVLHTINVTDAVVVGDLHVEVEIQHDWIADVHLTLTSPAGTTVVLQEGDGGSADDLNIVYADGGVAYDSEAFNFGCFMQPAVGSLAAFAGESAQGAWTLSLLDDYPTQDSGVLESVCLRVFDTQQGAVTCADLPLDPPPVRRADKVVLVLIDGLRYSDGLGHPTRQHVPNMDALAALGAIVAPFTNDGSTVTTGGVNQLMSGTYDTPVTIFDTDCGEDTLSSPRPTIHEYLRRQRALPPEQVQYVLGPYCPWRGSFHPAYGPAFWPTWVATAGGDDANWLAAQPILANDEPEFMVLYLPDVDSTGHSGDFAAYIAAIERADEIVGELWTFLQADHAYAGRTAVVVTNDHGRHWFDFQGHGDGCSGCREIQLLAVGAGVRSGLVSNMPRSLVDVTPTLGALLGVHTEFADGNIMQELFDPCSIVASEAVRLGTPANPSVLLPGATGPPIVGTTWMPGIDHTSFATSALVDFLHISETPIEVPLSFGTLLCSLPSLELFSTTPGTLFNVPVPNLCDLAGLTICAQALSLSPGPTFELTNALDATIGTF